MEIRRPPRAWVLNLDADLELEKGARYAPKASVRAAMRLHIERARASLVAKEDVVIGVDPVGDQARGLVGYAFCPTPRALALLVRAGAEPTAHPAFSVLRRVNGRAFCSSLGPTLPHGTFVTDRAAAHAMLARDPQIAATWRVKRAYGMAGRGQRVIAPSSTDPTDRAFVDRAIAEGGAQVEPNVMIVEEFGLHGLIEPDFTYALGALVRQRCNAHGAWIETTPIVDLAPLGAVAHAMIEEAHRVAHALVAEGYFGPFGLDGYTYRATDCRATGGEDRPSADRGDALSLQVRSEINARYSMGFAIGFSPPRL